MATSRKKHLWYLWIARDERQQHPKYPDELELHGKLHVFYDTPILEDGKWYCLSTKRAYLYTIQDTGQPDDFLICAGEGKHNLTSVSFVHQLQHFLFGLNLNSDLEV